MILLGIIDRVMFSIVLSLTTHKSSRIFLRKEQTLTWKKKKIGDYFNFKCVYIS